MIKLSILKFGGTSVGSKQAIEQAAKIVINNSNSKIVVVSAVAGITNKLEYLAENYFHWENSKINEFIRSQIQQFHSDLVSSLINGKLEEIASKQLEVKYQQLNEIIASSKVLDVNSTQIKNAICAFGEYFSSIIFSNYLRSLELNIYLADALELISFDNINVSFYKEYKTNLFLELASGKTIVLQGFIASDANKRLTNLGRGGSDYTAALIGAEFSADEVLIYTDVTGVYTADPRVVAQAKPIDELSLNEIRSMALFGAKVVHHDTILPALNTNIDIYIRNTFEPNHLGTKLISSPTKKRNVSFSIKNNCQVLKYRINHKVADSFEFTSKISSMKKSILLLTLSDDIIRIAVSIQFKDFIEETARILQAIPLYSDECSLVLLSGLEFFGEDSLVAKVIGIAGSLNSKIIYEDYTDGYMIFSTKQANELVNQLHRLFYL